MNKKTWRDFEKAPDGKPHTKTTWKKMFESLPKDSSKKFNGKIYQRPNFSLRNDKIKARKAELKSLGYSVRVVKKGKFSSIYTRPNFENKSNKRKK